MSGDHAMPSRDPPIRVEIVYQSDRTRVTRLVLANRTLIRKQSLGPDAQVRLCHERTMLERLRGVGGIVQLANVPPEPGAIDLDDVNGVSLASVPLPLPPDELIDIAVDLARTVAAMHRRGVMHTDIGPANIVLGGSTRSPHLIDFALASSFAEIRPAFTHHNEIVGTLAYLAPEQTGRTGRPVDRRADLYALGATLYELATGAPPFGSGDALRLTHDHLARIPVAPADVDPALPAELSAIIMHLLEKEPDSRYQTAEGLVPDLLWLRDGPASNAAAPFRVGEHDFPLRLLPPSRLVGRATEIATLGAAFEQAVSGHGRGVLISGAPGVGKTSLINELRPVVTGADGWFVAGKFDQYRRDQEFDGVVQAFRSLGRLLLAEPDDELLDFRERMLQVLGPNAGLVAASVPELAVLLQVPPDPGDSMTAQIRGQRTAVQILRGVVSRKRPMVFVLDDLQWCGPATAGFIDMILNDGGLDGLLLVGAYREDDVDAIHPLNAMMSRWRRHGGLELMRLGNLSTPSQAVMAGDMLRLDAAAASGLARRIAPLTNGNPYDIVELLNALRHRGILTPAADRWRWDDQAIGRYLATTDVDDALAARLDAMPASARSALESMACLGGRVELSLLGVAVGEPDTVLERRLGPALEDGLLVLEAGIHGAVQFRHDRVRETILHRLGPQREHGVRLGMARRLAAVADLGGVAAQQYLPVIDALRGADERVRVRELLRAAAQRAMRLADYPDAHKLLDGALRLTDPSQRTTLIQVQTARHAVLYNLGRLDDADQVYVVIDRLCTTALERADATLVQVSSLTYRNRNQEAIDLGTDVLRDLGVAVPSPDEVPGRIERGIEALHRWLDHSDEADDLRRPEITDQVLLTIGALIYRIQPAAYFADQSKQAMGWLALEALRIIAEHGPGPTLIGPAGAIPGTFMVLRRDYRTGYRTVGRVVHLGEARGYEPGTSQARLFFAVSSQWFEPLEESVRQGQLAREGLIQAGDPAVAGYTYQVVVPQLFDCTPSLDTHAADVDAALAFVRRTGSQQVHDGIGTYRWLAGVLRGEDGVAADNDVVSPERYAANLSGLVHMHINRALAAAVFGDQTTLSRHTAAAMPLLPVIVGNYPTAVAHLLRALALAAQIRATPDTEHAPMVAELDEVVGWLAERSADAPVNFAHLLLFAEAERAWALGDLRAALHAFDAAQREASVRQRPWHRALILEHAAQFHLADGMEHAGYSLLTAAREEYRSWGATAKVNDLDWAYPALHDAAGGSEDRDEADERTGYRRASVMTGTINLLGVLSASQALSSQTSIEGLRSEVVDVLSAMTGATDIHLLLHNADQHGWLLSTPVTGDPTTTAGGMIPVDVAAARRLIPMSVFRYVERIREPTVVNDAITDDRFARDPYFADAACCSMLAVPILNRGELQALLLLENRLIRGAFSTERLDGVMLIAGQLAISLDNAMAYGSLERKVAQRTDDLAAANSRLRLLSVTDPLTGVANRRGLDHALSERWRTRSPVAVAMIDIDHFKLYNDHFGHAAGDRCLTSVAECLQRNVREGDVIARYGGEEFAVVMADTDLAAARRFANRLRVAVEELAEPHPLTAQGSVTVSIGVAAAIPAPQQSADSLIESADAQLYYAKAKGRNQVRPNVMR